MVLVFPILFVIGAHLTLGPIAVIAALASRRFLRNIWVFAYFIIGPVVVVSTMMGISPAQSFKWSFVEPLRHNVESWLFPREMELCAALALRIVRRHPRDPANPFLDHELHTDLDVNYVCRNRMVALEPSLESDFYRATPIQMATFTGEKKVVNELIRRGARVSPSTPARFNGEYRDLLEGAVVPGTH